MNTSKPSNPVAYNSEIQVYLRAGLRLIKGSTGAFLRGGKMPREPGVGFGGCLYVGGPVLVSFSFSSLGNLRSTSASVCAYCDRLVFKKMWSK